MNSLKNHILFRVEGISKSLLGECSNWMNIVELTKFNSTNEGSNL